MMKFFYLCVVFVGLGVIGMMVVVVFYEVGCMLVICGCLVYV